MQELKPLYQKGYDKIQYFHLTNFQCVSEAMEMGLRPIEYRTWHYFCSCVSHGVEIIDTEAAEYLGINLIELYDILELLGSQLKLSNYEIIFTGENENV